MASAGDGQAELVRKSAGGDGDAFSKLVAPHVTGLLLLIRRSGARLLRGDFDEEDALQLVLEQVWRRLPGFEYRGAQPFYRWLVTIAGFVLADRARYVSAGKRGVGRHFESRVEGVPSASAIADTATSISRRAMRREAYGRAAAALEALEPKHRQVVERHLLEAQSLSEIAEALGITKNAVWERLRHGMGILQAALVARP
ncbi:MAG: RNA polymerase sigma factor [Planctomycetales bacterium]|nr:RNA polymerase sigma factor [Planctomycetales bacterium]